MECIGLWDIKGNRRINLCCLQKSISISGDRKWSWHWIRECLDAFLPWNASSEGFSVWSEYAKALRRYSLKSTLVRSSTNLFGKSTWFAYLKNRYYYCCYYYLFLDLTVQKLLAKTRVQLWTSGGARQFQLETPNLVWLMYRLSSIGVPNIPTCYYTVIWAAIWLLLAKNTEINQQLEAVH